MIISVEEAKKEIDFKGWDDSKIERKLKAVEQIIRKYTNNNFQKRNIRGEFSIVAQKLHGVTSIFKMGDTVQISESRFNDGLHTIVSIDGNLIELEEELLDESHALVTKVEYPADVVDCALNLLGWEVEHRGKVGIQSETLSRHSVTYFNMDGDNSSMGYPKSLLGCLKPYVKARF